jgi:hypothetical protein
MKRKVFYSILALSLAVLSGCTKQEDLNITMNVVDYGNLSVQVLNDNGTGIANVDVNLIGTNFAKSAILAEATSDANGIVVFNNMLSGNYAIVIDKVTTGGMEYAVNQTVQVISGITKEYKIKPSEYSGTAEFTVIDYFTYDSIAGVHVIIFPSSEYYYGMSFSSAEAVATQTGTTDSKGYVKFLNLPFNYYEVLIYTGNITDNNGEFYGTYSLYYKGQEIKDDLYY